MKNICLETERLKLHVASRDEMENLIDTQTDDVLKTAYREMLQGCLDDPSVWEWHAVWIIELKDGTRVGDLSFKGLDPSGVAEIGYGISKEYQNRGYATEAVAAALDWAFDRPDVAAIEAETEPENAASQRVLEKCGFVATGKNGEEGPRFAATRKPTRPNS